MTGPKKILMIGGNRFFGLDLRNKNRPNQMGVTICRILKIENCRVYLEGLDAVDRAPVLDIKPWVKEFARRSDPARVGYRSDERVLEEVVRAFRTKYSDLSNREKRRPSV